MEEYHLPLQVKQVLAQGRESTKKVVLVTGVFDLLHQEHIKFLQKAKQEGDLLLVALETDERVRAIKGKNRPVNDQKTRLNNLRKIGLADAVFLLPESFDDSEEHRAFIRKTKPDLLAVSSHTPHLEAKRSIMAEAGGKLKIVYQQNPNVSTSKLIKEQQKS